VTLFWLIFDPKPPLCGTHPAPPRVTWHLHFTKKQSCGKIFFENGQKMSSDILVDPLSPHVSFGDTIATPSPKYHIIWIILMDKIRIRLWISICDILEFVIFYNSNEHLLPPPPISFEHSPQKTKCYHYLKS